MGFIYLATSPTGKGYVGQTIRTIEFRWKRHVYEAYNSPGGGCAKLNCAIRKYGPGFTLVECWACADHELDDWETLFIALFDTFGPDGYNLTTGGGQGKKYLQESLDKMSDAHRVNFYEDWALPHGVTYITNRAEAGFRIRYRGFDVQVSCAEKSMLQKYDEALEIRHATDTGTYAPAPKQRPRAQETQALPTYVYFDAKRAAYFVAKPGHPRRFFMSKKLSSEEKLRAAIAHLETLQ